MKRTALILFTIVCSISIPLLARAGSIPADAFAGAMRPVLLQACEEAEFIACLGVKRNNCIEASKSSFSKCKAVLPSNIPEDRAEQVGEEFQMCFMEHLLSKLGIAKSQVDMCDAMVPESEEDTVLVEPAPGEMSPQERKAYLKYQKDRETRLNREQQESLDKVTLPLYKNAQVVVHLADPGDPGMLPALTMASKDPIDKVLAFYEKKLRSFKKYKLDTGYIFMEKAPADFDMIKHFGLYMKTPHVLIETVPEGSAFVLPGAKTKIEIAYRK